MKLLITGAAGFVASSLINYFNRFNYEIHITGIDDFSYGYKDRLRGLKLEFINEDILKFTQNNLQREFDFVIHAAATAPLPDNEINPSKSYENNVVNTIRIAEYCTNIGCKNLIFFSSGAIYENDKVFPSVESSHHKTKLVYPTSKMCAEHALNSFANSYKLRVFSLRLFNLYGPRQDYFRKQPPLIGYLIKCLIKEEKAILFSNGEQRRDYIYIKDVYKIINLLLNFKINEYFIPINLGSGCTYSVNEIIDILSKVSGKKLEIERKTAENYWNKYPYLFNKKLPLSKSIISNEVTKYSEADISKLKDLLNFQPDTKIEEGLKECFEYALKYFNL